MRGLAIAVALIGIGCEGGESGGTVCPNGTIADGDACDLQASVRCMTDSNDCRTAQVCSCSVTSRTFACEPVDFGAGCGDLQNADCPIEGNFGCSTFPISGHRECVEGEWQDTSSCPPGCPEEIPPDPGDACSVAGGDVCPYPGDGVECECVGAQFRCCDAAPCP